MLNVSEPLVFKQAGPETVWLQVYTEGDQCDCNLRHGGECTPQVEMTPDNWVGGYHTFCFEKYNSSTAPQWAYYGSPGTLFGPETGNGFTTADARTLGSPSGEDWWHVDNYTAYSGYSWWCGALTGDRCDDWDNAPGYGDQWVQLLVLDPDTGALASGATVKLSCAVQYDTECDYDYAYIQYSTNAGGSWTTIATFNGTSGSNVGVVCGTDYFGSTNTNQGSPTWKLFPATNITIGTPADFRIGFKFESDGAWSDKDGRGDTGGAFFVDNVRLTDASDVTLEYEDMDTDWEPGKWSIQAPPSVANYWWMAYDPDDPLEPEEGATICEIDESWCWTACPYIAPAWRIPPEANGFLYRLMTPKIYTGWGEPDVPKEYAGLVIERDVFVCFKENFCDYYDTKVNVYNHNPLGHPEKAGWCGWVNIDGYIYYGGCDFMNIDAREDMSQFMGAAIDSVWYAWDIMDVGQTGDFCWTTQNPKPHKKTQLLVDNVSIGLFDASATFFTARVIDMFQDSFDLQTDAHNALCANGDMPKVLAGSESLIVDIHDMNGLDVGGAAWVHLYFSDDAGATWHYNNMRLATPDPNNPLLGGTFAGSISPSEVPSSSGGLWTPGTEIWYYIEAKDDLGNFAYWPTTAAPGTDPPARPYYNNYLEFSILPGVSLCEAPSRILLVDDFGRNDYDYNPCMEESTVFAGENFYESILWDLGFAYDKYDVQGASTGLSNEPWGLLDYVPGFPDSVFRRYDTVIWFTSRFDQYTVLDTMQCRLFDFVRKGGNLFICGNQLGCDLTNYGAYDDAATDTCDFYGGILGAKLNPPGESDPGISHPHYYAVGTGVGSSQLTGSDIFHFHIGCPLSVTHDLTEVNTSPPTWAHPSTYLAYEGGGSQVVGIYNYYDDGEGGVGGKVIHMCFDLSTMVDSVEVVCPDRTYKGRYDLMKDVLIYVFGMVPCLAGVESDFVPPASYAYSLEQNYPNPFNPDTDINFSIRSNGRVALKVYNVRGQVVRTLVDQSMQAGRHSVHWDGTNDNGQLVSSGIYFCKMEAGQFAATKKMILLK